MQSEAYVLDAWEVIAYLGGKPAALTKNKKADLVTGDAEFKPLDGQIKIQWVWMEVC